jgi:epoxyqueuosine reductase QueG
MDPQHNYETLQALALEQGLDLFGVAETRNVAELLHDELAAVVDQLPYAISLAKRVSDAVMESLVDHPTLLYLNHYRQVNWLLDRVALRLTDTIQAQGFAAIPIAASQLVDWEALRAHVCHRSVAYYAGHGWFGRNNLLVNPRFGARIRLVTILTNLPLRVDVPLTDGCGECRACMSACPVGAIGESAREFQRDRCAENLKEFSSRYQLGQRICGLCIRACRGRESVEMGE